MVTINIYEGDAAQKQAGGAAQVTGAPSPGAESGGAQSSGSQGTDAPQPGNQFSSGQDQGITTQAPSPGSGGQEAQGAQADEAAPTPTMDFLSQSQSLGEAPSPSAEQVSGAPDMQAPQPSEQQINEAQGGPGSSPGPSANVAGPSPEPDKSGEDEKGKKK